MAVARLLASEPDMTVHCCHVAVEAVATAIRLVPSLILQDLRMPEIDGLALLVAYRRNPLTAATPVVVLSGNDDGAARAQAAAAGASGYLVKLPTKDDLIACIRQQVARAGVRPSSRPVPPAARTSSSLDRSVIEGLSAGLDDPRELVVTILDRFLADGWPQLEALNAAAVRWEVPALQAGARTLKDLSSAIGAPKLSVLCAQLEGHLERQPTEMVKKLLLRALNEEWRRVREACLSERERTMQPARSPVADS